MRVNLPKKGHLLMENLLKYLLVGCPKCRKGTVRLLQKTGMVFSQRTVRAVGKAAGDSSVTGAVEWLVWRW